jgi:Ni/Co efflux regulator RcnB
MKRILTAVAALAFVATAVVPAFADGDDHGRNDRDWQRDHYRQQYRDRDDRRDAYQAQERREWREGDSWQGHRVIYRDGAWGYVAPSSGFFIRINL